MKYFSNKYFIALALIATVIILHRGIIIVKDSEEKSSRYSISLKDKETTTEVTISATTNPLPKWTMASTLLAKPQQIIEEVRQNNEEEIIEEEQETIEKRTNLLYYINDNGYKSYLNEEYQDYLYEMCIKYDVVDYYTMFIAQMYHESTFRPNLISKTNDYGLMQINKCNHDWLSQKLGSNNFLDPYISIEAGVYMMSNYLHKYNDVEKALVCYNRGESAVRKGTYSTNYSKGVLYDMTLLVELTNN